MNKTIYAIVLFVAINLFSVSFSGTESPGHKYTDWNEVTVKEHIDQAQSGDFESLNALIGYYRNRDGGNDHKEALHWLKEAREQILSLPAEDPKKSERLDQITKLIAHEEGVIARLEMSEEELKPYLEMARNDDYRSILTLCSYYEYHQQFDEAIYWLKRAYELTDQRVSAADPMDMVRHNKVEEQYPDEESAKVYAEKMRKETLAHFDRRIKKAQELRANPADQPGESTSSNADG